MAAKNLIGKLVLLCVFEVILGVLICFATPVNRNGYIAAIQDKKSLLLNSKSPRIIFVGGSNLAFGLDSELIENELNLPVVNLGLHGGLGLKTSLNIVKKSIAQGDVVVLVPEYEYFNDPSGMYGTNDIMADFLEIDFTNIQYLAERKWFDLPLIASNVVERKFNRALNALLTSSPDLDVYRRSNFNSHGDMIGHLGQTSLRPDEIINRVVLQASWKSNLNSFDTLEEFNQKIRAKGGVVLFDFPPLRRRNCDSVGLEEFNSLLSSLRTHTTLQVLSTPSDRCYPDGYFFDTEYHLNDAGREIRTRQVIQVLSSVIK